MRRYVLSKPEWERKLFLTSHLSLRLQARILAVRRWLRSRESCLMSLGIRPTVRLGSTEVCPACFHDKMTTGNAFWILERKKKKKKKKDLTATSLRRKRPLARPGQLVTEARGLQTRLARLGRQGEDGAGGVVYVLQQEVQYRWEGRGCVELLRWACS